MRSLVIVSCLLSISVLAGCASKQVKEDPGVKTLSSYAPIQKPQRLKTKTEVKFPETPSSSPFAKKTTSDSEPRTVIASGGGSLKGRTLYVNSVADIRLKPGEVILTFDDGPVPNKTNAILNSLDKYGVKATFLMVGSMVKSYPSEVNKVRARGHTIGSHTNDHANLAKVSFDAARAKIRAGEKTLKDKTGMSSIPFFRFPYLASTPKLRSWLANRGVTVLDVDIDSKDYFKDSPQTIVNRTMSRIKSRGSGIVLFHDIHARSVAALPIFLKELKAAGYKVVTLKSNSRVKDVDVVASSGS